MTARVGVVDLGAHDHHDTGYGHPERPSRLAAIARGLADPQVNELVEPLGARRATDAELLSVHTADHLDYLENVDRAGGGSIDPDTRMSAGSLETARWSAGAGLAAIDALDRHEADAVFVATRPPGHHAGVAAARGFCLFNNVAIAATALADRGERVMIYDWDVHHGNGTQEIFWDDPRVLYVSTHEWPAYPGTGRPSEVGGSAAPGTTVNVPLPAGATGDVALQAFDDIVAPVVERFAPTWLLVSAGFDAHRADPLAELAWSAGDYALLTDRLLDAVDAGRTIAFLEGGYDLDAVRMSAVAMVARLGGAGVETERPTSGGPGRVDVAAARRFRERALAEWEGAL